ncbi:MAG TPA: hypothetical protein VL327_12215 [Pyrinomonadaceae bacterium]|jgi:hypothetical protein|nr:hypothetical protein [Pyrinomonadaceae bacterium]
MGATRHEKSFVDFEKGYEQNIIGFKGIIYFGIGLVLLIVITFALMWALLHVMRDQASAEKDTAGPMTMSDKESLPPEPRLQSAPGFGVDSQTGRVNLELREPQAEYHEVRKQWDEMLKYGEKDPKTGTQITMPVEQGIEKLLEENPKAKTDPASIKAYNDSRLYITDASAGRLEGLTRR